jgi:hypothetical protein
MFERGKISFESDIGEFWREEGKFHITFGYRDKTTGKVYWTRGCLTPSFLPVLAPWADTVNRTPNNEYREAVPEANRNAGALSFECESLDGTTYTIAEVVGLDLTGSSRDDRETIILRDLRKIMDETNEVSKTDFYDLYEKYGEYLRIPFNAA